MTSQWWPHVGMDGAVCVSCGKPIGSPAEPDTTYMCRRCVQDQSHVDLMVPEQAEPVGYIPLPGGVTMQQAATSITAWGGGAAARIAGGGGGGSGTTTSVTLCGLCGCTYAASPGGCPCCGSDPAVAHVLNVSRAISERQALAGQVRRLQDELAAVGQANTQLAGQLHAQPAAQPRLTLPQVAARAGRLTGLLLVLSAVVCWGLHLGLVRYGEANTIILALGGLCIGVPAALGYRKDTP